MFARFDGFGDVLAAFGRVLARAGVATAVGVVAGAWMPVAAKTPGGVHCYGGWCHRVATIDEMDGMVGRRGFLNASFYDHCKRDRFNPCGLTSSGAVFRADLPDNAASPIFPDGTVLLVYNHDSKQAVVVRVTSAGPYWGDRKLDLSRAAAERLGFSKRGVATLEIMVLKSPEPHEARYKKLRTYEPVPGYLGRYETFEDAQDAAIAGMRLETNAVQVAALDPDLAVPSMAAFDIPAPRFPEDAIVSAAIDFEAPVEEVRESSVVEVLGQAPPRSFVAVRQIDEESLNPSFVERLSALVEIARQKARLDTKMSYGSGPHAMALVAPSKGFAERVSSFIQAAQERARLSRQSEANASGVLAAR